MGADQSLVDGTLEFALGSTLRALRRAAGLTLVQLAEAAELSQPFLSQLENDQATPSLTALNRIARALGTTVQAILASSSGRAPSIVRSGDSRGYEHSPNVIVRFLVADPERMLAVNEVRASPETEGIHGLSHAGDEVVHVMEGLVEVELEGEAPVTLGSGDTYAFTATVPHSWRVVGPSEARFLMIGAPPSF